MARNMTWLPKSVVCIRYYDRSRFRSDAFAGFLLSLQIFPLAIAVAIAIGVRPLYGISCAAVAGLLMHPTLSSVQNARDVLAIHFSPSRLVEASYLEQVIS